MMAWSIYRVTLPMHEAAASARFFGQQLGLGAATQRGDALVFGDAEHGLHLRRPTLALARPGRELLGPVGGRHVAIAVDDLHAVATRLDRAGVPHADAGDDFAVPALYTLDPSRNLIAFCQQSAAITQHGADWRVQHVNLQAMDVREAVGFYVEVAGMQEGQWQAPPARGNFSIDPRELAVLPCSAEPNSGLHIIRPDPGFAHRNGFAHNPSLGGHPAFCVRDLQAVKARLQADGVLVTDAGTYAMRGMHQLYVQDPVATMIEVNQVVG